MPVKGAKKKPKVTKLPGFSARSDSTTRKAIEEAFGDGTVGALLSETMSPKLLPAIEKSAASDFADLVKLTESLMGEGFDMDNTAPALSTIGTDTVTPGAGSKAWAPLALSTRWRKKRKMYRQALWADHADSGLRLVTALASARDQLQKIRPRTVDVWPKGKTIKIGGTTQLKFRYALIFPRDISSADAAALYKILVGSFVAGRWQPLKKKDGSLSRGFRSARAGQAPEGGAVLYPEYLRPMLGPVAASSGRVMRLRLRLELRRLLK